MFEQDYLMRQLLMFFQALTRSWEQMEEHEQDYLMRQLLMFFQALTRSWEQMEEDEDPQGAADTLENAISAATDIDGTALLSLAPESIAAIMQVTGIDPHIVEYLSRSMLLESVYLEKAGNADLAAVRSAQAHAVADAYGFGLPDDPSDFKAITEGLDEAALAADPVDFASLASE